MKRTRLCETYRQYFLKRRLSQTPVQQNKKLSKLDVLTRMYCE